MKISTEVVKVTPAMATAFLDEKVNCQNRTIDPNRVKRYAADMRSKNWTFTGDPIVFSEKGKLVEGQHRCAAIVSSGCTIDVLIVRGVKDEAMLNAGEGKSRSFSDYLKIKGVQNYRSVATVTRRLVEYESQAIWKSSGGNTRTSNAMLYKCFSANCDDICEASHELNLENGLYISGILGGRGNAGLVRIMTMRREEAAAIDFWIYLGTGIARRASGRSIGSTSAPHVLREKIQKNDVKVRDRYSLTPTIRLAWAIKAWNLFLANKPCTANGIRWCVDGGNKEEFPKFAE